MSDPKLSKKHVNIYIVATTFADARIESRMFGKPCATAQFAKAQRAQCPDAHTQTHTLYQSLPEEK